MFAQSACAHSQRVPLAMPITSPARAPSASSPEIRRLTSCWFSFHVLESHTPSRFCFQRTRSPYCAERLRKSCARLTSAVAFFEPIASASLVTPDRLPSRASLPTVPAWPSTRTAMRICGKGRRRWRPMHSAFASIYVRLGLSAALHLVYDAYDAALRPDCFTSVLSNEHWLMIAPAFIPPPPRERPPAAPPPPPVRRHGHGYLLPPHRAAPGWGAPASPP